METCTEEVGLLKKKPCGKPKVAQCANCEQPLCSEHAVAQVTPAGKKTGKFMCKDHYKAWLEYEKSKPDASAKPATPAPQPPKPAVPPAASPKEAAKPAPEEKKPENPDGSIDFTPSKK